MVAAVLVPLVVGGALVCSDRMPRPVGQRTASAVALAAAVASAACVGVTLVDRPVLDRPWVTAVGMRLSLGVDGISAPLLALTAAIGVLVVLYGIARPPQARYGTYLGCLLLVVGAALLTFLARDAVLFFLAFEIVLVPMWLLIKGFGDPATRDAAAARFVLYTVLGSTLMLVGILALTFAAGTADLTELARTRGSALGTTQQTIVAALLLVGLGIKVPLFPFHSWLPAAHTAAPTTGSVLLAAVLLKMGTYGVVRLAVGAVPEGFARLAPVVGVLAVVGILWGGLVCLVERSLKRLIAWSSVAHMGFVMLALAAGGTLGVQAALLGNIAHGVVSALLFFVVGGLKDRWHGDDLDTAREGLRDARPRLGLALVVGMAGSLALPGLATFWGEVLTILAAWDPAPGRPETLFAWLAVLAALGGVLAAAYALRVLRIVWAGGGAPGRAADERLRTDETRVDVARVDVARAGATRADETRDESLADGETPAGDPPTGAVAVASPDAVGAEWVVITVLVVAVLAVGVLPTALLAISEPDVLRMLGEVAR